MSEKFLYTGLGFPIELNDVTMIEINNELQPVIDVKKVSAQSIRAFATAEHQITGNEFAFIRTYLQLPLSKLTKLIHCSEKDVHAWEALEDKPVNMPMNVEKSLKRHMQTNNSSLNLFSPSAEIKPSPPDAPKNQTPKKNK